MTTEPATSPPSNGATAPFTILLVEDNRADALLIQLTLNEQLPAVQLIHDLRAEAALARLKAPAAPIHLVLSDKKLPGMSGLDLCHKLRCLPQPPPIIIMTGAGSEDIAVAALKAGVDDYLVKDVEGRYLELLPLIIPDVLRRHNDRQACLVAEADLHRYAADLKARNEELDAFASMVAHDLKSPLSTIAGFATLLSAFSARLTPDVAESVDAIDKCIDKALTIVDELLLLARTRRSEVKSAPIDMKRVVHNAVDRLSPMIDRAGADISIAPRLPLALGHAPWIEEVWANYISNAVKYGGRPPAIHLGATRRDGHISYFVRDNGAGVAPELRKQIFNPYHRAHGGSIDGHGLGLAIVERIVTKLNGQVGVRPAPDRGSEFFFTLPAA